MFPDTLRFAINTLEEIKVFQGIPIENKGLQVDEEAIDAYFTQTTIEIEEIPADFLVNCDETGIQPYASKGEKMVVVTRDTICIGNLFGDNGRACALEENKHIGDGNYDEN